MRCWYPNWPGALETPRFQLSRVGSSSSSVRVQPGGSGGDLLCCPGKEVPGTSSQPGRGSRGPQPCFGEVDSFSGIGADLAAACGDVEVLTGGLLGADAVQEVAGDRCACSFRGLVRAPGVSRGVAPRAPFQFCLLTRRGAPQEQGPGLCWAPGDLCG